MIARTTLAVFMLLTGLLAHAGGPSPQAARIIDELSLRAADKPVSALPGWAPKKVLVTLPPMFLAVAPDYPQLLQAAAGDVELVIDDSGDFVPRAELLQGVDALIGLCSPATVAAASKLFWLHNYFVGMDRCATLGAEQVKGRVFTNGKRLSGPAIAEHSIAMVMALARGLPAYQRAQVESRWDNSLRGEVRFGELNGRTMLVVGLGGIGTEVAWRAHGLGMNVIATRNSSRSGPDYVSYVGLADELHELAGRADVVVNALPLTPATSGLFDRQFFAAVKPGALFISVGRGKSTVTADLVAALESGQLYGAGLDVTDPEPLPADSPLWQLPNVIITPHSSAAGGDSLRRGAIIAAENLRRYVAGEALLNTVNMEAGY
ncbi:D-2-hydroxyacid dehydrogenase [Seongchinamella sediminis]|uniref:D-2-hydroxyacid dehydrogenase n=1 Tax=Seongchinamella sediminis TaxID=2283635 RepID=UPI0013C2D909|nr:D-2-hydroxyacid dehydrogenase [Seongchinamella sediminis]